MKFPLSLRRLEDRLCPTLSVLYAGGNLTLFGRPQAVSGETLLIQRVSGTAFTVTDNLTNYGSYNVTGNLTLRLQHYADCDIEIDLNGGVLPGNLSIDFGLGNTAAIPSNAVSIYSNTAAAGTGVGGSVELRNGSGQEYVVIGSVGLAGLNPPAPVRVGGDVRAALRLANAGGGDTLVVEGNSLVSRDLIAQRVDNVSIGTALNPNGQVSRNVIANAAGTFIGQAVTVWGRVNGDLVVIGTADPGFGDQVVVETNAVVAGNVTAALQDGFNLTRIDGKVSGGLTHVGGAGEDVVQIKGQIAGEVQLLLGDGDNELAFFAAAVVNGSMTVRGGNGGDTLNGPNFGLTGFEGTVHGNLGIDLGHGVNTFTLVGTLNGARLDYVGGSGVDSVTINSAGTYALRAYLGAGADVFTYGVGALVGSALLDFGVDFDADQYVQLVPLIFWTQTLLNLP